MRCLSSLLVASLLAEVLSTIVSSLAHVHTLKRASPALHFAALIWKTALLLPTSFRARNLSLHLPTVALRIHQSLTSSARPVVARPSALVLFATKQDSMFLAAAPSMFVVCVNTLLLHLRIPTKALSLRSHPITRLTRSRMTKLITRMRALPAFTASLSARMWRQSRDRLRIDLLSTPTLIILWHVVLWQVAAWASPLTFWRKLAFYYCRAVLLC